MVQIILVIHLLTALAIIALILLQQGKGAEAGASFGAGASQTVFGSGGSWNFFSKATAILATVFFATSVTLAVLAKNSAGIGDDYVPELELIETQELPVSDIPGGISNDNSSDIPVVPGDF